MVITINEETQYRTEERGGFNKDCPLLIIPSNNQVVHTTSYKHASNIKKDLKNQELRYLQCKSWKDVQNTIDTAMENGDEQVIQTICNFLERTCLRF